MSQVVKTEKLEKATDYPSRPTRKSETLLTLQL